MIPPDLRDRPMLAAPRSQVRSLVPRGGSLAGTRCGTRGRGGVRVWAIRKPGTRQCLQDEEFSFQCQNAGREVESSLCFSLRPLLELRMRLAPCVVLRFGAARSQGGRRSLRPARVSGIKDASEGTAALFQTGANAAAKAVYSGAARVDLLLLEEEATDVRKTKASRAWRAGRRAVRSAGSAIEAISIGFAANWVGVESR